MDFDLTDEQRLLKDSVDRLIADQYQFEQRKKYLARTGWLEPRRHGSSSPNSACSVCRSRNNSAASAADPVETMIVMEAFGRGLVLEPYFATVILGGGLLRHAATRRSNRR